MLALLQSQLCHSGSSAVQDQGAAMTLDAWILRNIAELKMRQSYNAAIIARAQPFQCPKFEVMQELHVQSHVQ